MMIMVILMMTWLPLRRLLRRCRTPCWRAATHGRAVGHAVVSFILVTAQHVGQVTQPTAEPGAAEPSAAARHRQRGPRLLDRLNVLIVVALHL